MMLSLGAGVYAKKNGRKNLGPILPSDKSSYRQFMWPSQA
jgi:hypothetical protein